MTKISSRRRNIVLIGLPALVLSGSALWFLTHSGAHPASAAVRRSEAVLVTMTRAAQRNMPVYLTGIGTVAAKKNVVVRTRIDGQLDEVDFKEGQDVRAGQLLARLDPRVQQAQLAQAQAQKAKDQAQLANAELDLRRYTALMKLDATTRQTLDAQRALVAQIKATLLFDQAQISYATTQASFTRITAPISGRTGALLVDAGNIVHAGDANGLVVINQIDPITVVFTLPEDSVQAINAAQRKNAEPLTVIAYARNGSQALGRGALVLLDNQIDTGSGTIQVKADFPNPDYKLWPGQYVNARLILGERKKAVTVPAGAVQRGPDGTYVYVVDAGNKARMQPVRIANIQDGVAIIDDGLNIGQKVVLDGQYKLSPGLAVIDSAAPSAIKDSAGETVDKEKPS